MSCRTRLARRRMFVLAWVLIATTAGVAAAQTAPTTREIERLNWMEFRRLVLDVIGRWDALGL